eukprot:jgi/Ulvmu1/5497/UM023_0033.1
MSVCVQLSSTLPIGAREIAAIAANDVNEGTPLDGRQTAPSLTFSRPVVLLPHGDVPSTSCAHTVSVGSWRSVGEAEATEAVEVVNCVAVYITTAHGDVERSGASILVPIPHDAQARSEWGHIMEAFNWESSQPINDETNVEDIFTASDLLGQGPFLFYTEQRNWLPFQLYKYNSNFTSRNIWVSLYDSICNRIFTPSDDELMENSTLLSRMDIAYADPELWELYQEHGLESAVPYPQNATALHMYICPKLDANFLTRVRPMLPPSDAADRITPYTAALVYDAILLASALHKDPDTLAPRLRRNTTGSVTPTPEDAEAIEVQTIDSLQSIAFTGASGSVQFTNYTNGIRRSSETVRVSVLSQPDTGVRPSGQGQHPALDPVASVALTAQSSELSPIGNQKILWPSREVYPREVYPPTVPPVMRRQESAAAGAAAQPQLPPVQPPLAPSPDSNEGIVIGLAVLGAVVGAMLLLCMAYIGTRVWQMDAGPHGPSTSYAGLSGGRQGSASSSRRSRAAAGPPAAVPASGEDVSGVRYVEMLYGEEGEPLGGSRRGGWRTWVDDILKRPGIPHDSTHSVPQHGRGGSTGGGDPLAPGSLVNIGTSGGMWEVVGLSGRSAGGSLTPSEDASAGAVREAPAGHMPPVVPLVPIGQRVIRAGAESDAMDTRRSASSVTGSGTSALQGPPGLGEVATLVITDIQSSSKLWELMPDAFYADQKEHDRLLRHMMLLYNGREVCTEGDSFQVVFRDATDALRWCVAVQMQLLNINWRTTAAEDATGRCPDDVGTLCVPSSSATCPLPASVKDLARKCRCPSPTDSRVMFHGLRVRMGGHTARVTHLATDPATNQMQYRGELLQTARAVSDACAGGQIVFTQATISAVYSMTHLTSSKFGDVVLLHEGRHYLTPPPPEELDGVQRSGGSGGGYGPGGVGGTTSGTGTATGHFQRMLAEELAEEEERRVAREMGNAERHAQHGGPGGGVDGSSVMWLSGYSGPIGEGRAGLDGEAAWSLLGSSEGDEGGVSVHMHGLHAYERLDMGEAASTPGNSASGCGLLSRMFAAEAGVGPVAEGVAGEEIKELEPPQVWPQGGPAYDQVGQVSPDRPVPHALRGVESGPDPPEPVARVRGQSLSFEFPMGARLRAGATEETASLVQGPGGPGMQRLDAGVLRAAATRTATVMPALAPAPAAGSGMRSNGASSSLASQFGRGRGSWGSLAGTDTGTPSAVAPQRPLTYSSGTGHRGQTIPQEIRGIRERYLRAQLQSHRQGSGGLQPAPQLAPQLASTQLTLSEDFLNKGNRPNSDPMQPWKVTASPRHIMAAGSGRRTSDPSGSTLSNDVAAATAGAALGGRSLTSPQLELPGDAGPPPEGAAAPPAPAAPRGRQNPPGHSPRVPRGGDVWDTRSNRTISDVLSRVGNRRHSTLIGDSVSPSCSSVAGSRTVVHELYTVLPAYLVPRHQLFPTLNTHLKVTPSYAEAPRDGMITICYSYISSLRELDAWSAEGGRAVVRAATALVRDQLLAFGGYEVREMSGNFLLAFRSPDDALRFCISAQHAFMQHAWDESLLQQQFARAYSINKALVFRGPRVHMGLSSGSLSDGTVLGVVPDPRTGKAAYDGPLAHHAARVASVAHGGQIVASDTAVSACSRAALTAHGVQLKDLGLFAMKGFRGAHRIWQVEDVVLSRRPFGPPKVGKATPMSRGPRGVLSGLRQRWLGGSGKERMPPTIQAVGPGAGPTSAGSMGMTSRSIHSSVDADAEISSAGPAGVGGAAAAAPPPPPRPNSASAGNHRSGGAAAVPQRRRPRLLDSRGSVANANQMSVSASGPSASTERGERHGQVADEATVFSDETAWCSTGHHFSSLFSDVRMPARETGPTATDTASSALAVDGDAASPTVPVWSNTSTAECMGAPQGVPDVEAWQEEPPPMKAQMVYSDQLGPVTDIALHEELDSPGGGGSCMQRSGQRNNGDAPGSDAGRGANGAYAAVPWPPSLTAPWLLAGLKSGAGARSSRLPSRSGSGNASRGGGGSGNASRGGGSGGRANTSRAAAAAAAVVAATSSEAARTASCAAAVLDGASIAAAAAEAAGADPFSGDASSSAAAAAAVAAAGAAHPENSEFELNYMCDLEEVIKLLLRRKKALNDAADSNGAASGGHGSGAVTPTTPSTPMGTAAIGSAMLARRALGMPESESALPGMDEVFPPASAALPPGGDSTADEAALAQEPLEGLGSLTLRPPRLLLSPPSAAPAASAASAPLPTSFVTECKRTAMAAVAGPATAGPATAGPATAGPATAGRAAAGPAPLPPSAAYPPLAPPSSGATPSLPELQAAVDKCDDAIDLMDTRGVILHVNQAWTEMLGHAPATVLGRSFTDLLSSSQGFQEASGGALAAGMPPVGVTTKGVQHVRCGDGGTMWQLVHRVTFAVQVPLPIAAALIEFAASNPDVPPPPPPTATALIVMSNRMDITRDMERVFAIEP